MNFDHGVGAPSKTEQAGGTLRVLWPLGGFSPLRGRCWTRRSSLPKGGFTASGGTTCGLPTRNAGLKPGVICDSVANFHIGEVYRPILK